MKNLIILALLITLGINLYYSLDREQPKQPEITIQTDKRPIQPVSLPLTKSITTASSPETLPEEAPEESFDTEENAGSCFKNGNGVLIIVKKVSNGEDPAYQVTSLNKEKDANGDPMLVKTIVAGSVSESSLSALVEVKCPEVAEDIEDEVKEVVNENQ